MVHRDVLLALEDRSVSLDEAALPEYTTGMESSDHKGRLLPDWCDVYEGLSDKQIADIESVVLDRSGWARTLHRSPSHKSIFVATAHAAPPAKDHQPTFQQMENVLDKAAENMTDISDGEFNEAVDEALDHVRRRTD